LFIFTYSHYWHPGKSFEWFYDVSLEKIMKNRLFCLALLLINSDAHSQSLYGFIESIKNSKFTRIECERKSAYSKNHVLTPTSIGKYAKPNFYDSVYIDLIENANQRDFEIWWDNSSKSKFNKEFIADNKLNEFLTSYRENIKVIENTSSSITLQSLEDITGRIDIFELDKNNGNLKMYIWEMKTTKTKKDETFKFKPESAKEDLLNTEIIDFNCK